MSAFGQRIAGRAIPFRGYRGWDSVAGEPMARPYRLRGFWGWDSVAANARLTEWLAPTDCYVWRGRLWRALCCVGQRA